MQNGFAVALVLAVITPEPSFAIFGLFGKGRDRIPTKEEVAAHDRHSTGLMAEAEKAQSAGEAKNALRYYKKIVKKYYFSTHAPEATFQLAELLLSTGKPLKAFPYYQMLVDRHRSSPRFQRAVEQQYNIAVLSLTKKHSSFLGLVPMKTSKDRLIKIFETIIANAPASTYAANAQYYIGRTYERKRRDYGKAVEAFQKVVDEYPRSEKAPQAQLKIAEIHEKITIHPDNPTNLRETREAYEDFITNFPQHGKRDEAQANLHAIGEKEDRKNLKLAKFYRKRGNMKAAAIYLKDVLASPNAALKLEARQSIKAIAKVDPEALEMARIDSNATKTPPAERLKNQANYLGPPAPDLVARMVPAPKEGPTASPSTDPGPDPPPAPPDASLDRDSPIPAPPPAEAELPGGGGSRPESPLPPLGPGE